MLLYNPLSLGEREVCREDSPKVQTGRKCTSPAQGFLGSVVLRFGQGGGG